MPQQGGRPDTQPLSAMAVAPQYRWMLNACEFLVVGGPSGKPSNLAKHSRVDATAGAGHGMLGGATGHAVDCTGTSGYVINGLRVAQPTEITLAVVYRCTAFAGAQALVGHYYGTNSGYSIYTQDTNIFFANVPNFTGNLTIAYPGSAGDNSHWYAALARTSAAYGQRLWLRNLNTGVVVKGTAAHVALSAVTGQQGSLGYDGPSQLDPFSGYVQMGGMWTQMWTDGQATEWLGDPYAFIRRRRSPPLRYRKAAGTIYNSTVTAGLTPSALLVRIDGKPLAATMTPGAVIARNAAKVASGGMTPSAILARTGGKALSGSMTPTATIARVTLRALSASLTPSVALARKTARALAGIITPAASIMRTANKAFAATLTPSGALGTLKSFLRAFSGAITPTGAVARTAGKALAASISPTAALVRRASKVLAATLTPTGVIATGSLYLRSLAAALTPSGGIARNATKIVTATLSSAGALARSAARSLAASLTTVGTLAKVSAKLLTGTLTAAGGLVTTFIAGVLGGGRRLLALFRGVR